MELPMNDPTPQKNASSSGEPSSSAPEEQEKDAINLNKIFPDSEQDLNKLFLDDDMRQLLKNVSKNKSDLGKLNNRLQDENKEDDVEEEETESSSNENEEETSSEEPAQ
jgi:hypothetical protein